MLGIITAVKEELQAITLLMSDIKELNCSNLNFYAGKINQKNVVVVISGVGKVNAAFATTILIEKFNPTNIINIGSSGALNPELNIGDIVISTKAMQHDFDLTILGLKKGQLCERNDVFFWADKVLLEKCNHTLKKITDATYQIVLGPVSTGDQFCNDPEIKLSLFKEFGTFCDEMEGAAIMQICEKYNIPVVLIRSISDKPTSKEKVDYYSFCKFASKRCANFLNQFTLLSEI